MKTRIRISLQKCSNKANSVIVFICIVTTVVNLIWMEERILDSIYKKRLPQQWVVDSYKVSRMFDSMYSSEWFRSEGWTRLDVGGMYHWDFRDRYLFAWRAYYDNRTVPPSVRILTVMPVHYNKTNLRCLFKDSAGRSFRQKTTVHAYDAHREDHQIMYHVALVTCLLSKNQNLISNFVTLSDKTTKDSTRPILVYNNRDTTSMLYNFTVCLQPIHNHASNREKFITSFIEFTEISSILGTSVFVGYIYEVDNQFENFLKTYNNIILHNFTLPGIVKYLIHNNAQQLALLDCFYRHMWTSKYIVNVDIDESIIPTKDQNWADMVTRIQASLINCSEVAELSFKHALFLHNWCDDTEIGSNAVNIKNGTSSEIVTVERLRCLRRDTFALNYRVRAKYIANPRYVVFPGIHVVHAHMRNKNGRVCQRVYIDPSVGFLGHYRRQYMTDINPCNTTTDESMKRFGMKLMKKKTERHKDFKNYGIS